ncbi:Hypothetical protein A7982_01206 [Minicystis rosea]|nr:Hypothetical protein A7982_01206 [Minicystis rosea]
MTGANTRLPRLAFSSPSAGVGIGGCDILLLGDAVRGHGVSSAKSSFCARCTVPSRT